MEGLVMLLIKGTAVCYTHLYIKLTNSEPYR